MRMLVRVIEVQLKIESESMNEVDKTWGELMGRAHYQKFVSCNFTFYLL